ncbi:EMC3/TMCO1 family protein [Nitrososphaera viennensis]|uniref:EMC3/TMCO1 family protein n=2 Tax=Nitrososphaera viennensis TaxID=1034015 RepID=A0A977IG90_9ARCH|nr:EMC3/TMCO1 family protein [Nitrososphaera viennensis]AIC15626.1 putative membrane protein [Nitrososphaera viennensis EN76]UVS70501.1 EMC3/TMCO1 family protein [Nitrososphaera viennensis]
MMTMITMLDFGSLILQLFSPQYTRHPIFPDFLTATIVAMVISVAMSFAFAMLRRKTTDIERVNRIMKETNDWRKAYTAAVKKGNKAEIEELKKKQAYVNKMALEVQQQQMRPMLIYMLPSFLIWIFVFPSIFGQVVALSPIHIPWIMCSDQDVQNHQQLDDQGNPKGACQVPGEVYLWGWFLLTSFAFSGIVGKVTKTSMPSI